MSVRSRLIGEWALLGVAMAAGVVLRFHALGGPSYWLDEILGEMLTKKTVAQPWWHWLTGLDREHGPLYYAFQLASRLAGHGEAAGRTPAALFGLAAIPLVWLAGRAVKKSAAGVCALLLAVSPLHVYYSREARPYALLLFLTAALLAALLLEARPAIPALLVVAVLYTSAAAGPLIAAVAVAAGVAAFTGNGGRRDWLVGLTAAVAACAVPLLYRGAPWVAAAREFPGFDRKLASLILHGLTVSALGWESNGRTMLTLIVAAGIGGVALIRTDRRAAVIVLTMTVLPAILALLSLSWFGHWFAIRYIAPSVVGFLLLAGIGIVTTCDVAVLVLGSRWPDGAKAFAAVLAVAIAAVVAIKVWPAARREPFQKLDWRAVAVILEKHARAGDVILAAEPYSYLSLGHYLKLPPEVHFVLLDLVPVGEQWVRTAPATWLVTAGYSTPVSQWMCRYPLVLASPLEAFRLHYAPSAAHFLVERALPAERRAAAAALGTGGFTLRLGPEDELFLGEGWGGAEVARWAAARRAGLVLPRGRRVDRLLRFRAYPLSHSGLPPQTMRVSLNGAAVASLTLAPEWREYELPVPAGFWIEGVNRLDFDFSRTTAPADVDPSSSDRRQLAVTFEWIAVADAGAPIAPETPPPLITVRVGADRFLDEETAWRETGTHLPAGRLRREAVEPLLARLGFDPASAWPRLARGEVRLDNVVETLAYGEDCEDQRSFLRRAFRVLLQRPPSEMEERDLLARLASHSSRVAIVGRIVKSSEFRGEVLAP